MALIQPSNFRAMSTWCDAFTLHLDAVAEARNDPRMRASMADALKRTASEAKRTASEQDVHALRNQQAIARQATIGSSPEEHREVKAIWKRVKAEMLGTGWDISEEIHIARDPADPRGCCVWQGPEESPPKGCLKLPLSLGGMVRRFLLFIAENSQKLDPVAHTKQVLEAQGITEKNFHQHADRLAITNPWAPAV